jgi:hypothetical protein
VFIPVCGGRPGLRGSPQRAGEKPELTLRFCAAKLASQSTMDVRILAALPLILVVSPLACATVGPTSPEGAGGEAGTPNAAPTSGGSGHGGNASTGGLGGLDALGGLGGGDGPEPDKCCVLGAMCHVVGGTGAPKVEECHQIGHEDDPSECQANFERCTKLCEGLNDEPEPHSCDR